MLTPEPVHIRPMKPEIVVPPVPPDHEDLKRFRAHYLATKPWASICLGAVLIGVFCLQLLVGHGDSTGSVELVQLGGLVPSRVMAGEWWRLIGWSFLHIGGLHIFMNGYALYVIGTPLERVVGSARFMVIYTAAVLLGAIVVMTTSEAQLTAGASGGIFGLLGAEAVLVLSPRSPLPMAMRLQRRNVVLINFAINIFYSFRPNVSFAGHAGGFIAGAVVALLLPTTLDGLIDGAKRPLPRVLGLASTVLLAVGLLASVGPTLPMLLSTEPVVLAPQALPGTNLRAEFPVELGELTVVDANTVTVGNVMMNRAGLALVRIPNEAPMDASEMDAELRALLAQFESEESRATLVPEGMVFVAATMIEVRGRQALRVDFGTPNTELVQTSIFLAMGDAFVRLELIYWARYEAVYSDAAERIAASIE